MPGLGLGLDLHVPGNVARETLYILQPDADDPSGLARVRIELEQYTAAGFLHRCHLEGPEEIALFVQMAARLGDGEAACFAIAAQRGWALGTDDRRAGRLAAEAGLAVVTTPELIKLWAEHTRAGAEQVAAVLRNIERFARFVPRPDSPECDWWESCLGRGRD